MRSTCKCICLSVCIRTMTSWLAGWLADWWYFMNMCACVWVSVLNWYFLFYCKAMRMCFKSTTCFFVRYCDMSLSPAAAAAATISVAEAKRYQYRWVVNFRLCTGIVCHFFCSTRTFFLLAFGVSRNWFVILLFLRNFLHSIRWWWCCYCGHFILFVIVSCRCPHHHRTE